MKICIAGKNWISIECLKFISINFPWICISTLPNRDDKGIDGWQPSLRKFAAINNIRIITQSEFEFEMFDFIFSLECDTVFKTSLFKKALAVNLHFSLLPNYRGVYTSAWPILNGEEYSGVTLHLMDQGIDTGLIISQTRFRLAEHESARSLYHKYERHGLQLFMSSFPSIIDYNFTSRAQIGLGSYYDKTSIDYSNLNIDFYKDAVNVSRQVRAYYFPAFQVASVQGVKICNPKILDNRSNTKPGTFIKLTDDEVILSTQTLDISCKVIK